MLTHQASAAGLPQPVPQFRQRSRRCAPTLGLAKDWLSAWAMLVKATALTIIEAVVIDRFFMAFILIVAFDAMLLGAFLVMLGYKVRKTTSREWLLYLTGGLSILFGILVLASSHYGWVVWTH